MVSAREEMGGFCSTGAAEDGRAPSEERSGIWSNDFCSTGAAEDGRYPTEWSHISGAVICEPVTITKLAYSIYGHAKISICSSFDNDGVRTLLGTTEFTGQLD